MAQEIASIDTNANSLSINSFPDINKQKAVLHSRKISEIHPSSMNIITTSHSKNPDNIVNYPQIPTDVEIHTSQSAKKYTDYQYTNYLCFTQSVGYRENQYLTPFTSSTDLETVEIPCDQASVTNNTHDKSHKPFYYNDSSHSLISHSSYTSTLVKATVVYFREVASDTMELLHEWAERKGWIESAMSTYEVFTLFVVDCNCGHTDWGE